MGQERFHVGVEDWGHVKRQELGKEQAAYDRHSQRTARRAPASSSKFAPRYNRLIPPATAAPRSSAACHQIASASDDSPQAGASMSGHAKPTPRRSSPTVAASWSATSCRSPSRKRRNFTLFN